ncbi:MULTISPECIES: alpha/beta hydrolase [unclassified Knoellia]|uniref:alpha/beta hydrolase n=1 Tax=Knoellia altitudinis TaxID=3404795 RepID=UPI00361AA489
MKDPLGRLVAHDLRGTMPPEAEGVALVLHGGGERGYGPMPWWEGPVVRMRPFARAIERRAGGQLAVVRLKNRYFGWNGIEETPLADARWALDRIHDRYAGLPIALIGHSMGGRVVTHLAGEPGVTTVVALAPWVEDGDPRPGRPGLKVLLMHGVNDGTTDPRRTEALGEVLRGQGADVTWRPVEGDGHSMLRHPLTWHREVAEFVAASLLT